MKKKTAVFIINWLSFALGVKTSKVFRNVSNKFEIADLANKNLTQESDFNKSGSIKLKLIHKEFYMMKSWKRFFWMIPSNCLLGYTKHHISIRIFVFVCIYLTRAKHSIFQFINNNISLFDWSIWFNCLENTTDYTEFYCIEYRDYSHLWDTF